MTNHIIELLKKLESYGFECEAGLLTNCIQWKKLKEEILVKEAISATRCGVGVGETRGR
ncbi:MAG: hypothetical protein FD174_2611 [Geobacteraceae bacterium]|nr:MAG: hypothetical protein FD174_2611 [Geobacteraceae bacterium]